MDDLKRVLRLVAPHWRHLLVGGLCSAVVSLLNGALAWMVKPLVDEVFVKGDNHYLTLIALSMPAVFLFRGLFTYGQNYLMNSIGAKVVRDLRDQLFKHLVYLPLGSFGKDTSSTLLSRVMNDAGLLQTLLAFRVKDLFVSAGTVIVLVVVAMYRRWELTLLSLTVLPLAFYFVDRLGKRLKKFSLRAQERLGSITESISEGLRGLKIIKSFNREQDESIRFQALNRSYYRDSMRAVRITEAASLIMEVVSGFGVALIVYYGGALVATGEMTSGDFFSFLTAVMMIYTPAKRLAQVHNGFQQVYAYLDRIDEVLVARTEPDGTRELAGFKDEIAIESVSFCYPEREENALKSVDITVRKGEVVALVGRSGSGKTTLLDLLSRFYLPHQGCISIDGVDIKEFTLHSLRAHIGIVSQDVVLFNDTIAANIAFGKLDATKERIEEAARAAFAHEFIMELPAGYDTHIGEGGARLSGGQRQRISIARAILKDPDIFILDEATSSLDTQSEAMVQQAIDRLIGQEGRGKTVFIIAHRLSTVKRSDRIVVLDRGRVMESGTHEQLLAAGGLYSRLHELQYGTG